jgi:cation:H+ antiporter
MFILYFLLGFLLLYYGADFLVRGSSSIAVSMGVKKIVIGLSIVAMGTSLPEFVVSLFAAIEKVDGVSVGNIVGSNLANILLILGLASVIHPIGIKRRIFFIELPVLLGITLLFVIFCRDGRLTGLEGVIMFVIFLVYMIFIIANRKVREGLDVGLIPVEKCRLRKNVFLIILGIAGLVVGGQLTVRGAIWVARLFGISELVIGLTVVAIGTSLPELFTSIVAVIKKEDEISIGNIIGSNMFNTAFVMGLIPLIRPLSIDARVIRFDNFFMLGTILLLSGFLFIEQRLTRRAGGILLIFYTFFILNSIFHFI